jgi:hypothetical protein
MELNAMSDFDNTNRGVLFPNDKKETENHPDRKGTLNVEGKDYWFSAWDKVSAKGDPYISVSIQEKKPLENPEPKKDWIKPELRNKFETEDRNDDSAKHEVILDDDFDGSEPVDLSGIPF